MNKWLLAVLAGLVFHPAIAADVEFERNVQALVVNQEAVDVDLETLPAGKNQLVVKFEGRLKKEHVATKPYVLVLSLEESDKVEINFIPRSERTLEKMLDAGEPLFEVLVNGVNDTTAQVILPPRDGFMPYSNIAKLVMDYNRQQGVYFDSNDVETLEKKLVKVQTQDNIPAEDSMESEASLQLKIWYSRATEAERKAFRRWMIDQE